MPTYDFIDILTGKEFESFMKIAERDEYLKDNPHIQPIITAPHIVSGVVGIGSNRVPNGFNEVLSKVAEAHPTSKVGQQYGNKSIKQVQSEQVVKKHVDRITKRIQGK
jgi:hypothetical protein